MSRPDTITQSLNLNKTPKIAVVDGHWKANKETYLEIKRQEQVALDAKQQHIRHENRQLRLKVLLDDAS